MPFIKFILRLGKEAFYEWSHDRAARLGAALAYYALFSMAPLLVIMTTIAGSVYGESAAEGQLVRAISDQIGPEAAIGVERLITGVYEAGSSLFTTLVSGIIVKIVIIVLLFKAVQAAIAYQKEAAATNLEPAA